MRLLAWAAAPLCLAVGSLTGCATLPRIDECKDAATRRAVYVAAIAAADAYAASGRPVPTAVVAGRAAAVTALAIVDARCPPAR